MATGIHGSDAEWEREAPIRAAAAAMAARPEPDVSIPGWTSRPGDVAAAIYARVMKAQGQVDSFDGYMLRQLYRAEVARWRYVTHHCDTCSMTARVVEAEMLGWGVPRESVWKAWALIAQAELRHLQAGPCDCELGR